MTDDLTRLSGPELAERLERDVEPAIGSAMRHEQENPGYFDSDADIAEAADERQKVLDEVARRLRATCFSCRFHVDAQQLCEASVIRPSYDSSGFYCNRWADTRERGRDADG